MIFFRQHPVREDALSAYIDGALSGDALSRVERHLESCERCRSAVEELRAVRSAVQELPRERAPRSFALRRADIEAPRQVAPSGVLRTSPMLGAVATIALLAFFSLVGLDVADGPSGSSDRSGQTSSLEAPEDSAAGDAAEPAAEAADGGAPPQVEGLDDNGYSETRGPQAAATAPDSTLSFGAAEATRTAYGAELSAATAAAPLPATGPEVDVAADRDDDSRTGLRAAEAATAAVAIVAGGTFALAWWRRRV